tara:strand:- start:982 stop:1134 length:153 start_codon:yes stop_codon:yes gene_type:complete
MAGTWNPMNGIVSEAEASVLSLPGSILSDEEKSVPGGPGRHPSYSVGDII